MKQGQQSITDGIENILIPMENFKCTQGDFEGNHPYYACDMAGRDAGRDLAFFPFSARCMAIDTPQNGNAVWWESLNPVRFADGTIDYCNIMVIHDNNLAGIRIGISYQQGQKMAQEGTAGMSTGNHLHIEFAKGRFTKMYEKNEKGYYLPNGQPIELCCFADDTVFLNSSEWSWKSTNSIKEKTPSELPTDFTTEVGTFTCEVDMLRIRKGPGLQYDILSDWYENGMSVHYDGFISRDDYIWISWKTAMNDRHWMAVHKISTDIDYGSFQK